MKSKRGLNGWIWILIILILIGIGVGLYFLLSGGEETTQPSELPDGECTDSDGGYVIDVKGQTGDFTTGNFYNDVCFIRESETETTSTTECSGNNCYLKEYGCDSQGNIYSQDVLCEENKGFTSCKNGACIQ